MQPLNAAFKFNKFLFLLGSLLGIWFFLYPGTLFVSLLTVILLYLFGLTIEDRNQRRIILNICILAISLRFLLSIGNYYLAWGIDRGADFIGDARAYSGSGQYIAEVVTRKPMPNIDGNEPNWARALRDTLKGSIPFGEYRVDSFARYIGWIYSTFGYDPITVKLINSLLSISTGILLFLLIKDMFSVGTAKITLVLSIFWPSIFLWSVTGTKDSLIIFLLVLWVSTFSKLRKYIGLIEFSLLFGMLIVTNYMTNMLFFICVSLIMLSKKFVFEKRFSLNIFVPLVLILAMKMTADALRSIRLHIFIPMLLAFSLSIFSFLSKKKLIFLLMLIFCLGLFSVFYITQYNFIDVNKYFVRFMQNAIDIHKNQLLAANSAYRIFPDKYYMQGYKVGPGDINIFEFSIFYFKGIAYSLFSPFPWSIISIKNPFVYSQMIIYYMLFPFIILGVFVTLRYKWRDFLSVIIFLFVTASMLALFEGNIGTVFRHRDMLIVFFLFFGAIGISKTIGHPT